VDESELEAAERDVQEAADERACATGGRAPVRNRSPSKHLDTGAGDAVRHQPERFLRQLVPHHNRLIQRVKARADAVRILGEYRRDRLTLQHLVSRLHGDDEADRRVDDIVDGAAAAAERDDRATDGARLDALHDPRARAA